MYSTNDPPPVHAILVDDHVLVAEGLKQLLLKILPEGSLIDVFSSVDEAKESMKTGVYSLVITDLAMPGQNVTSFIATCRNSYRDIVILVVSSVIDAGSIKTCLAAGASGYLSKAADPHEIKLALEYTFKGKKFISGDLSGRLADSFLSSENTTLTNKEVEILRLIASGKKVKDIAEMLYVSPITIMTHKRNIMKKLNLHSATELVKYVYENNLI